MKKFQDFNLKPTTMQWIQHCGFTKPTPIQEAVIPQAIKGKDIIGLSKTGTGKTHAYLIPLMEMLDSKKEIIQAVVTAPTRELAVQIYEKAMQMQKECPQLRIRLVVGGKDRQKDIRSLSMQQPHLVIGTPGRIRDLFLDAGVLRLEKAKTLVVDEADMTLEFGFLNEIDAFAGRMSPDLQMLAFSATMPEQLKPFLKKYMHHPLTISMEDSTNYVPKIHQVLVPCRNHPFADTILSILPGFQPYVCLIFANTRKEAGEVAKRMKEAGIKVTQIHGDMTSRQRKQSLKELESNRNTYVVCTDLAARGLDIPTVTHVISCGLPEDLKYFTHRCGRTARAGGEGVCYTLYHEEDAPSLRALMNQGIHFDHERFTNGAWKKLRPYGIKRQKKDDEMDKKISMMMTKKNTKVKPGYKKRRAKAIEKLQKQKHRDYIRGKIKEEKKARYKESARKKYEEEE